MKNKLDAVIIAGGLGTRLKQIQSIPKLLTSFGKKTNLEIIINNLDKHKINNKHLLCGKDKDKIGNYLKEKKNCFLYAEQKLLGTAGCLTRLKYEKLSKNLLVIYGDLLFNIDIKRFYKFHLEKKSDLTILSHPSDHLFDSDIIQTDKTNAVKKVHLKPHNKKLLSNNNTMAGIFIIKKKLIKNIPRNKKYDFSKNFLKFLNKKKKYKLFSYNTREYCKDFGTSKRLKNVRKDFNNSKHNYLYFKKKIPAVFLDRDGVLNKDKGPYRYSNPTNFFKNTLKALLKLRKSKYLIIQITNQSGVAKGIITLNELEKSIKKYEMFLSKEGFYFDKIYFCPHHPLKGFKGENKKFKIKCSCRKPKPGLIYKAKKEFNIELKKSFFVGDNITDHKAAYKAGVKSILLNKDFAQKCNCLYKKDILSATNYILKQ